MLPRNERLCEKCKAQGLVKVKKQFSNGWKMVFCPDCKGTGSVKKDSSPKNDVRY